MKNVINVGRKHFILKSFISSFGRKQLSCQALFPLRRPETFILQGFYFSPSTGNSYLEKCHFLSVDRKQLSCKVYISSSSTGNIYLARFSFPYRRPKTFILKVFISSPSVGNIYFARFIFLHRRPETVILQGFHFRSPSAGNSNSAGKTGNIYLDKFSFPLRRPETNSAKERRPSPSISSNSRT